MVSRRPLDPQLSADGDMVETRRNDDRGLMHSQAVACQTLLGSAEPDFDTHPALEERTGIPSTVASRQCGRVVFPPTSSWTSRESVDDF